MPLKLTTYYQGNQIPKLPGTNTFHSTELFHIYEATPGYTPLLIVASENGVPVAKLLAAIRKVYAYFHPPLSNDVKYMVQESILMKQSTRKLFSVICYNGLLMKPFGMHFLLSSVTWKTHCLVTKYSAITSTLLSTGYVSATLCIM